MFPRSPPPCCRTTLRVCVPRVQTSLTRLHARICPFTRGPQLVFGLIVVSIVFGDVIWAGLDRVERAVKRKATARAWGDRKPGIEDDWEEFRYDLPAFTDGASQPPTAAIVHVLGRRERYSVPALSAQHGWGDDGGSGSRRLCLA